MSLTLTSGPSGLFFNIIAKYKTNYCYNSAAWCSGRKTLQVRYYREYMENSHTNVHTMN